MRFKMKIKIKMLITYMAMLTPIVVLSPLFLYNQKTFHNTIYKVEDTYRKMSYVFEVGNSTRALLMPSNDYLITGDIRERENFNRLLNEVEMGIKRFETLPSNVATPEELKILKSVREEVERIRGMSLEIFNIEKPVGSKKGAELMKIMATFYDEVVDKKLVEYMKHVEKEFSETHREVERIIRRSWIIMVGGPVFMFLLGIFFAFLYSRLFTTPIEKLQRGAETIAGGNFDYNLDIHTGDEIEQLANEFNRMGVKLKESYRGLEDKIIERTGELRESEQRYRNIIQTSMDGFWIVDSEGRILDVNDAYCKLTGYEREELLKMRIPDVEAKESTEETAHHIQEIMTKGYGRFETRHRRKDGQLLDIEVSTVYKPDIEGEHFFVFLHDITKRKRVEEKIARHVEDLERYMKATILREFRIKELRDENEALKLQVARFKSQEGK